MKKLIILCAVLLGLDILTDASLFRWERTWLSSWDWLSMWRAWSFVPGNLWHSLSGVETLIPIGMALWYVLEYKSMKFDRFKRPHPIVACYDGWTWKNYAIYIGLLSAIWVVYNIAKELLYHVVIVWPYPDFQNSTMYAIFEWLYKLIF